MKIKTEFLFPGMESLNEVSNSSNDIILYKGTILSEKLINKLKDNNIDSIEIVLNNTVESINGNFREYIKDAIKRYDIERLKYIASLFTTIYNDKPIMFDLTKYTRVSYDLYDHIVNITLFATSVAYFYNMTNTDNKNIDLCVLALSCMLSKYGLQCKEPVVFEYFKSHISFWDKNAFPNIKAEDFYTYNEKCNTLYAYLLLKEYDIDENVRENILLSSEYYNNDSSPLGARLKDYGLSSDVAALISVADTYDMLLIEGAKKDKEEPFKKIIDKINEYTSYGYLNPFWVKYMLLDIPLYREGEKVVLSDGTIAIVDSFDPLNALKPKIVDLMGNKIEYKDGLRTLRLAPIEELK